MNLFINQKWIMSVAYSLFILSALGLFPGEALAQMSKRKPSNNNIKRNLGTESKTEVLQQNGQSNPEGDQGLIGSYRTKYKTSLSLYLAEGSFKATAEEESANYSEIGAALEVAARNSPNSVRLDLNTKTRSTSSGALGVTNDFREYRAFIKRTFTEKRLFPAEYYSGEIGFFVALGLGALVPETHFKVANSSTTIESQAYLLQAAMAGVSLGLKSGIFFDLFAQASFASPYPKGNLTSIGLDVGASF